MGLSFLEIGRVVEDLSWLEGAFLQQVYVPSPTELVLELRADRETCFLLLSIHPRLSRLHLIARRPPNPLKPFPFQMLCRKELSGRLERLEQLSGDRAVKLTFQGASRRVLVAELTDRHSNVFLLDEAGTILGMQIGGRIDGRALTTAKPYQALPPSPRPARALDRFSQRPGDHSLQAALETWSRLEQERIDLEERRGQLRGGLRREQRRLERRLEDLAQDLERAERAEQHRRFGDLLQIHLREIPRGRERVVVHDVFQDDEEALIEIPLDPQLDPVANVQRHYRLYRKYDASIGVVLERIDAAEKELRRLAGLEAALDQATTSDTVRELEKQAALASRPGPPISRPGEAAARRPFWRYLTPNGMEIWVGRSASDNDELTFRTARGNDFWLHVRGRPGAHVVIPARGTTPDLETLLDAACLSLRHSGIAAGERAEVAYTRAKYVRRIPGSAPGLVTYSQDKTLFVEHAPERLNRLTKLE